MKSATKAAGLIGVLILLAPTTGTVAAGDVTESKAVLSLMVRVVAPSKGARDAFLKPLMSFVGDKKICEIIWLKGDDRNVDNEWAVPRKGPKKSGKKDLKESRSSKVSVSGYDDREPDKKTLVNQFLYHCDKLTAEETAEVFTAIKDATLQATLVNNTDPDELRAVIDALPISTLPCSRQLCYSGTYAYVTSRLSCACQ